MKPTVVARLRVLAMFCVAAVIGCQNCHQASSNPPSNPPPAPTRLSVPANAAGDWLGQLKIGGQPQSVTLGLNQLSSGAIDGFATTTDDLGGVVDSGSVNGNLITLHLRLGGGTSALAVAISGTLSGDTITGTSTDSSGMTSVTFTRTVQSFRSDPRLNTEQISVLSDVDSKSRVPITVAAWGMGGSVQSLKLNLPTQLTTSATKQDLITAATQFVNAHLQLWNLTSTNQLTAVDSEPGRGCGSITFQQIDTTTNLPIYNAKLRVTFSTYLPNGQSEATFSITAVEGRIRGGAINVSPARLTQVAVFQILQAKFPNLTAGNLPDPIQAVYDPLIAGDASQPATVVWLYPAKAVSSSTPVVGGSKAPTNDATKPLYSAISPLTHDFVITAQSIDEQPFWDNADNCPDPDPSVHQPMVNADPDTGYPAHLSFGHFGGLRPAAQQSYDDLVAAESSFGETQPARSPVVQRAYRILLRDELQRTFRYRDVFHVFGNPITLNGGRVVRFQEYESGMPVEGAGIVVQFNSHGFAASISTRFEFRPDVDPGDWQIWESDAVATARASYVIDQCREDMACRATLAAQLGTRSAPITGVILSKRLFPRADFQGTYGPRGHAFDRAAWKVAFPFETFYVDAYMGNIMLREETGPSAFAMNWDVQSDPATTFGNDPDPTHWAENIVATQTGTTTASATVDLTQTTLNHVSAALADADTTGMLNVQFPINPVHVHIDLNTSIPHVNAYWCSGAAALESEKVGANGNLAICPERGAYFRSDFLAPDVIAHELTHGMVEAKLQLPVAGQGGALNEAFADIFAMSVFPSANAGWVVGDTITSMKRPLRDLQTPSRLVSTFDAACHDVQSLDQHGNVITTRTCPVLTVPFFTDYRQVIDPCTAQSDVTATLSCCPDNGSTINCRYAWSTVVSHAAQQMADGIAATPVRAALPALGRDGMAYLHLRTMFMSSAYLPSSTFVSHRYEVESACRDAVNGAESAGGQSTSHMFVARDCDTVAGAFDDATVPGANSSGWWQWENTAGRGTDKDVPAFFPGSKLVNGCSESNQFIVILDNNNGTTCRGSVHDNDGCLKCSGNDVTVCVAPGGLGSATDSTDRSVVLHVQADWWEEFEFRIEENAPYNWGPGIDADWKCLKQNRILYSVGRASSHSSVLGIFGSRDTTNLNNAVTMPAGCVVDMIFGEYSDPVSHNIISGVMNYTRDFGFLVTDPGRTGLNQDSLDVTIHTWVDSWDDIDVRAQYSIFQPAGTDCSVLGSTQDVP
jgi:hypothetical protein